MPARPGKPGMFTIRRAWVILPDGRFSEWFGDKRAPLIRVGGHPYKRVEEIVGSGWSGVEYCTLHAECREHLDLGRECALKNPMRYRVRAFVHHGTSSHWDHRPPTFGRVLYHFGELTAERPAYASQDAYYRAHPTAPWQYSPFSQIVQPWTTVSQLVDGVAVQRQRMLGMGDVEVLPGQVYTFARDLPQGSNIERIVFSDDAAPYFTMERFEIANGGQIVSLDSPGGGLPGYMFTSASHGLNLPVVLSRHADDGPHRHVTVMVRNVHHASHRFRASLIVSVPAPTMSSSPAAGV